MGSPVDPVPVAIALGSNLGDRGQALLLCRRGGDQPGAGAGHPHHQQVPEIARQLAAEVLKEVPDQVEKWASLTGYGAVTK